MPENADTPSKSKAELKAERKALYDASKKADAEQQKTALTKAERRALQSADERKVMKSDTNSVKIDEKSKLLAKNGRTQETRKVYLFEHLPQPDYSIDILTDLNIENEAFKYNEAFFKFGKDTNNCILKGATARCIGFIAATRSLIKTYESKGNETFSRSFVQDFMRHVAFVDKCRPLPIPVQSFIQYIKQKLVEMDNLDANEDCKTILLDYVDDFEREQITLAGEAIKTKVSSYIKNGELICTYAYSCLVAAILKHTWENGNRLFSVLVVDSGPLYEGRRMIEELTEAGIPCQYTSLNALPSISENISLVILGVHGLLSNGHVLARMGSSQFTACLNQAPVLVCAETYKFWDRAQSDAFEFNEMGNPNILLNSSTASLSSFTPFDKNWREKHPKLHMLNLEYDVIPPYLVTAVVTELGIIPTSSVPVILRVKQASMAVV